MSDWTMEALRRNIEGEGGATIDGSFGGGDAAVAGTEDGFTSITFPAEKPPLEYDEQAKLAEWAWGNGLLLYANANQHRKGTRPEAGQVPGVPDLFLAEVRGEWPGMYIEMKRDGRQGKKNGGLSDEQVAIIPKLRAAGYYVAVCYGFEEGKAAIERYREGKGSKFENR